MRLHFLFLVLPITFCGAIYGEEPNRILSDVEADTIVMAREASNQVAATELKTSVESVPALYETEYVRGNQSLILRRVAPAAELLEPSSVTDSKYLEALLPASARTQTVQEEHKEPVHLQLRTTVYDSSYSKIVVTYLGRDYTVWTNINFEYLSLLGSFETEKRSYGYFGMVQSIDQRIETGFTGAKAVKGDSRWETPPVRFTTGPEYILLTEDARDVPPELYQQIDDLIRYYLENEANLKAQIQNAQKLEAAKQRYRAARPEKAQDVVLNYSIISTPAQ